jgi:hypothetical protein
MLGSTAHMDRVLGDATLINPGPSVRPALSLGVLGVAETEGFEPSIRLLTV